MMPPSCPPELLSSVNSVPSYICMVFTVARLCSACFLYFKPFHLYMIL